MKEKTEPQQQSEKVFSISITLKDVMIMVVSSCFGIVLLGILITHDIAFGIIVALFSIVWTLATRCLTFNPNRYVEKQETEDAEHTDEMISGYDRISYFVIYLLTIFLGMLMIGKESLLRVSTSGEQHEIFNFSESRNIETAGWILVSMALFFIVRPIILYIKDKIW